MDGRQNLILNKKISIEECSTNSLMKKILFIVLWSIFTYSLSAQSDFKKRQKISNSILFMIETHDGKKYITNDALFHAGLLAYVGWLKIDEKYRKLGVTTFMHFRLEPGVQAITWTQFKKEKKL